MSKGTSFAEWLDSAYAYAQARMESAYGRILRAKEF